MRVLLRLLLLLLVAAAAFAVGRWGGLTPPRFEPQRDDTTRGALPTAWHNFSLAQQETLALLLGHRFVTDDQALAEAYRLVLYGVVGAIQNNALRGRDDPFFLPAATWTSKSGLDNPDNNYYVARLRDDADYVVRGTRGTTRGLVFQLLRGQPGVGSGGTSDNIDLIYGNDMRIESDGSFELYIQRDEPGAGRNWLRTADGAETLLVRHTHSDWDERVGELYIERVGAEGERTPPLSSEQLAQRLNNAARALYDRAATWLALSDTMTTLTPRNGISKVRASSGGLVGQYSAFGNWQLEDNEALVISFVPGDVSYHGVELGSLWFISLDYDSHTSSLSLDQAVPSADGRYYFVVSHRDPGIQNWLDTVGHRRGLIMMRWQGVAQPPTSAAQPEARLVRFDQLRAALPNDIEGFTAAQRREQIRQRRRQTQRRFGS